MGFRLILLGPPGVGKGTQAEFIREKYGLVHISTGDILREAVKNGTSVGMKAKKFMDAGELVPDEIVGEIIEAKLKEDDIKEKFLLDGFPRTVRQVEILDDVLEHVGSRIDAAFFIELDDAEIIRRLTGRRVCSSCGALYNVTFKPPRVEGICDQCGAKLIQRKDDSESVIRERLSVYRKETLPIVCLYDSRKILVRLNGGRGSEDVQKEIATHLSGHRR